MDINEFNKLVSATIKSPDEIIRLIHDVTPLLTVYGKGATYRPPGLVEINGFEEVYVIGDLHGDYITLLDFLTRERIFERIGESNIKIVFLGDYVDRGPQQLETIIGLLILKRSYPEKIILLRGNHEPPPLLTPIPHDFIDVLEAIYGDKGLMIYRAFFIMFQRLPYLARIPGGILLLHGGPPLTVLEAKSFEEAFNIGLLTVDDGVLEDILWSDPIDDASIEYAPSGRGAGHLYGPKITERTLELSNTRYIVRGHEPVQGYLFSHGGRVVTIFSSRIPVYGISRAGYIRVRDEKCFEEIGKCIYRIE